ncbi:hypothetical protein TPR58_19485 [Sphingomonas sp. HF-S3]|uniref:Zinc ribbon domain-containing protein n=1 Tax=Sphingomonas rustica TaxID=3103142 RepID=A0ABV0BFG5_9SPHN
MALVPCPECGRSISTAASACPGCGHPVAGQRRGLDGDVAGKAVSGIATWLVVPWIARAIVAVVGVIALFTFLGTR